MPIIDSTRTVLPLEEAFSSDTLHLSEKAVRVLSEPTLSWSDYPANYILLMVFTFIAIITLRRMLNILPQLLNSLTRWKVCLNIDASLQEKSDRNMLGLLYTISIALMLDRYAILEIGAMDAIPPAYHGLAVTALIFLVLLFRQLIFLLLSTRVKKLELFRTAHSSFFNYWILTGLLTVFTASLATVFKIDPELTRQIIRWEIIALYALAVLCKSQILRSFCKPFRTFLYLCALELVPTGALIAGVILL